QMNQQTFTFSRNARFPEKWRETYVSSPTTVMARRSSPARQFSLLTARSVRAIEEPSPSQSSLVGCLTSKGFAILIQRHPEEIRDYVRAHIAMSFIEPNRTSKRRGRVECDSRGPGGLQLAFNRLKQLIGNPTALERRHDRHPPDVAFPPPRCSTNGSNDPAPIVSRHEDGHGFEPVAHRFASHDGVFVRGWRVLRPVGREGPSQAAEDPFRVPLRRSLDAESWP